VGYRAEAIVDRGLIAVVRRAIDGDVRARALEIVRQRLDARPQVASEREAVAHALAEAEREGKALAKAIRKGGQLEALVEDAKQNDQEVRRLRGRLARLDAAPVPLDTRRRIAEIERRLSALSETLTLGGIAALPAVEAVMQGRRLAVTPVIVNGERRWQLFGRIPAGYLATIDGADPSASGPSCDGLPWSPSPSRRRRPSSPASAACACAP
jgi:hypothetical protein